MNFLMFVFVVGFLQFNVDANECGIQHSNKKCPNNLCCSASGFCGNTVNHCLNNCQLSFGLCWEVHPSTGLPFIGNNYTGISRCGVEHSYLYCSNENRPCCSESGYCGKERKQCGDGCQTYFGNCNPIDVCTVSTNHHHHLFPTKATVQRKKNYWYELCPLGQIRKNFTQTLLRPISCEESDPSINEKECVPNQIYNLPVQNTIRQTISNSNRLIVDGNLITCVDIGNEAILIDFQVNIKEIRITMRKTKHYSFKLEVVRQNDSFQEFRKDFEDVIKYGYTVIFSMTDAHLNREPIKRYIRLTPYSEMTICEMEVSPFVLEQKDSDTNVVILISCLTVGAVIVMALLIAFIMYSRKQKKTIAPKQNDSPSNRRELLNTYRREPRPPASLPLRKPVSFNNESYQHVVDDIMYMNSDAIYSTIDDPSPPKLISLEN